MEFCIYQGCYEDFDYGTLHRLYGRILRYFFYLEIIDINKHLTSADKKILDKLGIKIKNKKYTEYEYECLRMDFLVYYDDPEDDLSEEELQYQKSLDGTGVTREEYNTVLKKLETINETI